MWKRGSYNSVLITVTKPAFRVSHLLVACSDKEKAGPAEAVGTGSMAGEEAFESEGPGDDPDSAAY